MSRFTRIPREDVVSLLETGIEWTVIWCPGAERPNTHGKGPTLPDGLMEWIPDAATVQKYGRRNLKPVDRRRGGSKTYCVAFLEDTGEKKHLWLEEGSLQDRRAAFDEPLE